MRNLKVIETESKTFNLDKAIISNMGINEKDSLNFLSKVESIESQRINAKGQRTKKANNSQQNRKRKREQVPHSK